MWTCNPPYITQKHAQESTPSLLHLGLKALLSHSHIVTIGPLPFQVSRSIINPLHVNAPALTRTQDLHLQPFCPKAIDVGRCNPPYIYPRIRHKDPPKPTCLCLNSKNTLGRHYWTIPIQQQQAHLFQACSCIELPFKPDKDSFIRITLVIKSVLESFVTADQETKLISAFLRVLVNYHY